MVSGVGPANGWGAVLKKLEHERTQRKKLPSPYVMGGVVPTAVPQAAPVISVNIEYEGRVEEMENGYSLK